MRFFFITKSPELAAFVASRGVDRLFVDLEWHGKHYRQGGKSTVISGHSFEDLAAVRAAAPDTELMVRLNPLHEDTAREINQAVATGANVAMLPMYRSSAEAKLFCEMVAGRMRVCLLAETVGAMECLAETAALNAVDEIHIGLNDLHLELGSRFMFEPLANGIVDRMAGILRQSGKRFGIGGIARAGEGDIPGELLIGEHVRLGSTGAILSRTFHRNKSSLVELQQAMDFAAEVAKLRSAYVAWSEKSPSELEALHTEVCRLVQIAAMKNAATG